MKGHAHSHNTHWYKKIEGEWKFAGLNPNIRWGEYDFDGIFAKGREELSTENVDAAVEAAKANGIPVQEPVHEAVYQPTHEHVHETVAEFQPLAVQDEMVVEVQPQLIAA
jgi:hypothetical protein